jgi:hypothetical protein
MTDKWQTRPLVREDAPIEQDSNFHIGKRNLVVGPRRVLDTKTYWLTDRQSQYDFHFDFDSQEWVAVYQSPSPVKSSTYELSCIECMVVSDYGISNCDTADGSN